MTAIHLIEASDNREGAWDSRLAAAVARMFVQLEVRDSSESDVSIDFTRGHLFEHALDLATLPNARRLRRFQIILPETPVDKTVLHCERMQGDCTETMKAEYDPRATVSEGVWYTCT